MTASSRPASAIRDKFISQAIDAQGDQMTKTPQLENVAISLADHVAEIRLNRPDKLNALSDGLMKDLIAAADWADSEPNVRCVVLSGEGRSFCAGMDMDTFKQIADGEFSDLLERTHGIANFFQRVVWAWRECRVPVIAAVNGAALGGGFQLALGADIRIVHPASKMSVMEIKWGLIPDMAGTALMCHLASEDVVRELTYTARIFDGAAAKEFGFATHLSDTPLDHALTLAAEIASKSPDAVRAGKTLLNQVADERAQELLTRESEYQTELITSPNQIEAINSVLEKRPAKYENAVD